MTSISVLSASPHASDARAKSTRPPMYVFRLPMWSASEPLASTSAANANAYASITHCRPVNDALSERAMSGNATVTMVTSTSRTNPPKHTATSGDHFPIRTPSTVDTASRWSLLPSIARYSPIAALFDITYGQVVEIDEVDLALIHA